MIFKNITIKKKIIIILFILFIVLFILFFSNKNNYENYDSINIVSNLNNYAGFYSLFFFTLNHYIYCKKTKNNFKINSEKWLFKSEHGWTDYFEPVELIYDKNIKENKIVNHSEVLGDYKIKEYQEFIPELYKYNENTKQEINKIYNKFNLIKGQYDSLFIRRGDKLGAESVLILEDIYMNKILEKNPNCKIIYLQTDDYNCYKNIEQYIKDNKLNIKVYTLCNENSVGVIVHNNQKNILNKSAKNNESNKDYLSKNIDKLNQTKAVEDMNSEEIYKHTLDMVIGVDIVANSNICITDYQSNVSRFIKLFHKTPNNVYDVISTHDIDYEKKVCPSFSF